MAKARTIAIWLLGLVLLGAVAYTVLGLTARAMAEMKVKELLAGMQDVAKAEYGDVDVNLLDMSATIRDLRVSVIGGTEFRVGKLVLSRFEQLDGMPRSLSMSARGVHIPLSQPSLISSGKMLRELGFNVLALDYDLDFDYDLKTRQFSLHELKLDVNHAGTLVIRLALSNVDLRALMEGGPKMAFMAVKSGELRYEDHSLLGRVFEALARDEGISPDEVRGTLMQGISERENNAVQAKDEFSAAALGAVRRFLEHPGTIALYAQPAEEVAVMQLMTLDDPVEVFRALNLYLSTEQ